MHQWIKQLKEQVIQWTQAAKDWFSSMWSKLSSLLTFKSKAPTAAIDTGTDQATTPVASREIGQSASIESEAACVPTAFLLEWLNNMFAQKNSGHTDENPVIPVTYND